MMFCIISTYYKPYPMLKHLAFAKAFAYNILLALEAS